RTTWTARTGQNVAETLQRIQARARTILVDVGRDGVSNLAVTDLKLGVPLATTGSMIPITATVHHFGGDEAKSVRAELSIGKARAALNDPPFALRVVAQQIVHVPPGKNGVPVSFAHTFATPGDYVLQVRIESDALEP